MCLQVQLWPGPDRRASTWFALGFSEGKLRGMPSAHVPAGQGFACPLGPLLERVVGARGLERASLTPTVPAPFLA